MVSCTPNILRVATNTSPNADPENPAKNTPTSSPHPTNAADTPTPQTAGNFVLEPAIVNTVAPQPVSSPPPGNLTSHEGASTGEGELSEISIEALASRSYGQAGELAGTLTFESALEDTGGFVRALISYPSDGLKIYGFMNIPPGPGPFPVVIFLHGYVNPLHYETLDYSVRYTDDLARRGFIVIHPNLRGYPPSDNGPDMFETGKAIDVLNLTAIIQREAGKSGLLIQANPDKIAVWGHSTGGGVALRLGAVNMPSLTGSGPAIKAVILYAPMSGDDAKNAFRNYYVFGQPQWEEEIGIPAQDLQPVSPVFHYNRIEAAVQIHHGAVDDLIPVEWSRETCQQMQEAGVTVECYEYRTQMHNFCCDSYKWMLDRIVTFLFIHMP